MLNLFCRQVSRIVTAVLFLPLSTLAIAEANPAIIHGGQGIQLPPPPVTAAHPVTDDYFGTRITDNYRWLEDAQSPETREYLRRQMEYTAKYLEQIKTRPEIVKELTALHRVDSWGIPEKHGNRYFYTKREADENQASIYMRTGWQGKEERLIDATRLSADQNTSVAIQSVSKDGRLLVYGIRQGGADEQEIHVLDVETRQELPDRLPGDRYFGVALSPKDRGLYYARFTHQGTLVFFHTFGTLLNADTLVFGKEYQGQTLGEMDLIVTYVTENDHFLVIRISHGVPPKREDILVKDLRTPEAPVVPVVYGIEARSTLLSAGDQFFLLTNYQTPKGRIVKVTPGSKPEDWTTIVPEGKDVIDSANIVGNRFFVLRLKDVKSETTIYSLEGKPSGHLEYPGIGAASAMAGKSDDHEGFYVFQSFIMPPTIYRYDTASGKQDIFASAKVPFDTAQYELKQVFYPSKDGTQIPMFIAGKKGLKRDGSARLLMTGYGGFDLSETPFWDAEYAWWMEQGGWFALPNLRGGGEYGEEWHKQAMFEKKQNVFDDWFAAAEYLISNHYTTPEHFAIRGRSNGGLLMGASMTQRPELFAAIWCGYPLLDMLRYQKFLFGRLWTTEYGSAENEKDFPYLLKYSPYQNVKSSGMYPAIMFFTGDSDTRVDPLHARKMTPLMQAASKSGRPVLLHYSLKGGHSAGVSISQLIEDEADEVGFLWTETTESR
jgi:prolyl oligopeptidase